MSEGYPDFAAKPRNVDDERAAFRRLLGKVK